MSITDLLSGCARLKSHLWTRGALSCQRTPDPGAGGSGRAGAHPAAQHLLGEEEDKGTNPVDWQHLSRCSPETAAGTPHAQVILVFAFQPLLYTCVIEYGGGLF